MANDTDIFGTPAGGVKDADIFGDLKSAQVQAPPPVAKPQAPKPSAVRSLLGLPEPSPETRAAIEKAKQGGWGSGWPNFAYDLGGTVSETATKLGLPPEVAAGAGFGTNVLTQALPALLTSGSFSGAPSSSLLRWPAKWLMQTAVKPSTDDLLSGAAGKAIGTMLDEGIKPTMGGMTKAAKITSKLDEEVAQAISGSQAKVPVPAVASRLNDTVKTAEMQVNPKTDMAAVENAWTEFLTSPHISGKTDIPVQLAHELKRGTYKALSGKSYGEVGSTSVEAQKALARGLREETMAAVPEIEAPLARQAALMNVRDVAGTRALLESNKNPAGLAALRVDHPLSSVSFLADRWAWLKAFLALQANAAGKPQTFVPPAVAGGILSSGNQPTPGILSERR